MRRVEFATEARQDVDEIWDYISAGSIDAANRVAAAIEDAASLLAEWPRLGHTRADVGNPRYRFWKVYSYLIAYRFTDEILTIVRVVHGARDIRRLFWG